VAVASLIRPARSAIAAVRDALANDGIRRLELLWMLGIAADAGLLVILLVEVYAEAGALGAGILGAVRMGAAVATGMLSGALVARYDARRVLLNKDHLFRMQYPAVVLAHDFGRGPERSCPCTHSRRAVVRVSWSLGLIHGF